MEKPKRETASPAPIAAEVLVAEDNPVNQELAQVYLEEMGCAVTIAADGRQAVDALARRAFDIVFMDCHMPVLDGFAATGLIRDAERQAGARRVPIVALTADALEGDRDRCLQAGMDDYLTKPFTEVQLADTLRRWVKRDTHVSAGALDPAVIKSLSARPGLWQRVAGTYLTHAPAMLEKLRTAVAEGSAAATHFAAHSFKSASANIGAAELAELCRQLETAARANDLSGAADLLARIETEYAGVRASIEEMLAPVSDRNAAS